MNLRIPADYLTLHEIRERWKLPADSLDVHRAVLKGILAPSVFIADTLRIRGVGLAASDSRAEIAGWAYVQGMLQTGPFDCSFSMVSTTPDSQIAGGLFALEKSMTMADLFKAGVVMVDDLEDAESKLRTECRELSTKEHDSLLKVLALALADGYKYNPRERSRVVAELVEAGLDLGIEISDGTVSKFARMAFDRFPPSYMARGTGQLVNWDGTTSIG